MARRPSVYVQKLTAIFAQMDWNDRVINASYQALDGLTCILELCNRKYFRDENVKLLTVTS